MAAVDSIVHDRRFGEEIQLAVRLQLEAGIRVRESMLVRASQLLGLRVDSYTGELRGWIQVKGKGGMTYTTCMSRETYERLDAYLVAHGGMLRVPYHAYLRALRDAARRTGQVASGKATHGLRWNRAQRRFREVSRVVGPERAKRIVSAEMGHRRGEITTHYLSSRQRRALRRRRRRRVPAKPRNTHGKRDT
ncbi:MAG: hypothetical protein D6708_11130 [Candidatus Dadabacteria bacterium]|nr:MAG: hypothetical protein D6708_11130 [Candidatus Dadabacteria bacterium]